MLLLRNFLRIYSYVFETVLCGMGLLLCAFAVLNRNVDVEIPWLPWTGTAEIQWIAGLSLLGLILVGLAAFGSLRFLLFLFAAAVVFILFRGLFISTRYTFAGVNEARNALVLVAAAFLAFVGALPMRARRARY